MSVRVGAVTLCNENLYFDVTPDSLVSLMKSFQAFVTATNVRGNGNNTLRKSLRKALSEQWYATLLALQEGVARHQGEVKSRLIRLRLLWSASGHEIGLDEVQEKIEFDRMEKLKEQVCSWKDCEYHTQLPPIAVKSCKGCGQTVSLPCRYDASKATELVFYYAEVLLS